MLSVGNEVGRLRRVLVHEPGPEVDNMVPSMMEELLFDDILYGDRAREEHGRIRRVFQILGIEVVDAEDLLEEVLRERAGRAWILQAVLPAGDSALRARLEEAPAEELASALVGGVKLPPGASRGHTAADLFSVAPLPNWCFQRDPQIVVGRGVVFGSMASAARQRETLLARAVFRFHPDLAAAPAWHDPAEDTGSLEGGDLLVVSPDVLAVGLSERTDKSGILELARALSTREESPRYLVVVELPRRRAYMHLDTVFSPVDRESALVHAPVILPGGAERAAVYEIDLKSHALEWSPRQDLLSCLARRGAGFEPILCGGDDPIAQQREQWTDGANALALAPGVITMYDRNQGTMDELSRHGFRVVDAKDLLLGRDEADLGGGERICISLQSNELSRARGGPHCLTHPLVRDA